jgi:hypothetical protein
MNNYTLQKGIYHYVDIGRVQTVCSSISLVSAYKSTPRYNTEDQHRHLHRRENLKYYMIYYYV